MFSKLVLRWDAYIPNQFCGEVLHYFLAPGTIYLEIGAGDCSLACEVAQKVLKVYAIEVSEEIARQDIFPLNVELLISDGINIPVASNTINLAYSNNVMEHLHPDDALDQLACVYDALAPGGIYICITPNRISGPHDTSKYFDDISSGFHLKEYTIEELSDMFKNVGFSKVLTFIGTRGRYFRFPTWPLILYERMLTEILPAKIRSYLVATKFSTVSLGVRLIGVK